MSDRTILLPDADGNMVAIEGTRVEHTKTEKAQHNLEDVRRDDFFIRVGHCTESLHKFLKAYSVDYGLEMEEALAAVYLMNINNREFAPEGVTNWTEYYDALCVDVWNWFKKNKDR